MKKIIIGILITLILISLGCTQATGEAKKIIKENNTPTLFNKNKNQLNQQNNTQYTQQPPPGGHQEQELSPVRPLYRNCNSCEECSEKIQNSIPGTTIRLMQDITNNTGDDCIKIENKNNITLDGRNHTIIGQNKRYHGINIENSKNITIKNINTTNNSTGIYLIDNKNTTIKNTTNNNNNRGTALVQEDTATIQNSKNNNNQEGILILISKVNITNSEVNNNSEIGINNTDSSATELVHNKINSNGIGINFGSSIFSGGNFSKLNNNTINNNNIGLSKNQETMNIPMTIIQMNNNKICYNNADIDYPEQFDIIDYQNNFCDVEGFAVCEHSC